MKTRMGCVILSWIILLLSGCQPSIPLPALPNQGELLGFSRDWYLENGVYRLKETAAPVRVEIDLTDPSANEGRVIYQDGACSIYIDKVYYNDPIRGSAIYFRSVSQYDRLSGVRAVSTYDLSTGFSPKYLPVFRWEGEEGFTAQLRGYGGLDSQFGFYFPNDCGQAIPLPDTVTLEFPYLCTHTWTQT